MLAGARSRPQRGTCGRDPRGAGRGTARLPRPRGGRARAGRRAPRPRGSRPCARPGHPARRGDRRDAGRARARRSARRRDPAQAGRSAQPRARDRRRRSRCPRPRRRTSRAPCAFPDAYIEDEVAAQEAEIERRTTLYRGHRPASGVRRRHRRRGGRRRRHRRDVVGGAAMGARSRFRARGVRGAGRAGRRRSGCSQTSATTSSSWRHRGRSAPWGSGTTGSTRSRTSRCSPRSETRREGVRDRARRGVRRARRPFARVLDPAAVREPGSPRSSVVRDVRDRPGRAVVRVIGLFLLYASVDTQGRAFTDDVRQYDWFVMVFVVLAALQLLGGYFLGRRSGRGVRDGDGIARLRPSGRGPRPCRGTVLQVGHGDLRPASHRDRGSRRRAGRGGAGRRERPRGSDAGSSFRRRRRAAGIHARRAGASVHDLRGRRIARRSGDPPDPGRRGRGERRRAHGRRQPRRRRSGVPALAFAGRRSGGASPAVRGTGRVRRPARCVVLGFVGYVGDPPGRRSRHDAVGRERTRGRRPRRGPPAARATDARRGGAVRGRDRRRHRDASPAVPRTSSC